MYDIYKNRVRRTNPKMSGTAPTIDSLIVIMGSTVGLIQTL